MSLCALLLFELELLYALLEELRVVLLEEEGHLVLQLAHERQERRRVVLLARRRVALQVTPIKLAQNRLHALTHTHTDTQTHTQTHRHTDNTYAQIHS